MTYIQKSRRAGDRHWRTVTIVVLILVALVCLQIFASGAVERVALSFGGPVAKTYFGIKNSTSFVGAIFSSRSLLVQKNLELQKQLEEQSGKLLRFDSLVKENQDILAAYNRRSEATASLAGNQAILGNVVVKPPESVYDVLIVDVGTRDGIKSGNLVYALGGIPIGRVSEVTDSTAKVVLISSDGEQSEVVQERTGASIPIVGKGGGNMEATVPQDMDVLEGDKVTLPQFGAAIVATVAQIDSTVTSSSKRVLLRLPVSVFDLRWVEVAKGN